MSTDTTASHTDIDLRTVEHRLMSRLDTATNSLATSSQLKAVAVAMHRLPTLPRVEGDGMPILRRAFRGLYLGHPISDPPEGQEAAGAALAAVLDRRRRPSSHECAAAVLSILVDRTLAPADRLADLEQLCPGIELASLAVRAPVAVEVIRQLDREWSEVLHVEIDGRRTRIPLPTEMEKDLAVQDEDLKPLLDYWEPVAVVQRGIQSVKAVLQSNRATPPEEFDVGYSSEVQGWLVDHLYVEAALCSLLAEAVAGEAIDEQRIRQVLTSHHFRQ